MKFRNSMTFSELEKYVVNNQSIADEFNIKVDRDSVFDFFIKTVYDGYLDCDSQLFTRDRNELNYEIKEFESAENLDDWEKNELIRSKILLKFFDENDIDNITVTRG